LYHLPLIRCIDFGPSFSGFEHRSAGLPLSGPAPVPLLLAAGCTSGELLLQALPTLRADGSWFSRAVGTFVGNQMKLVRGTMHQVRFICMTLSYCYMNTIVVIFCFCFTLKAQSLAEGSIVAARDLASAAKGIAGEIVGEASAYVKGFFGVGKSSSSSRWW
jgi:hypothetical protein